MLRVSSNQEDGSEVNRRRPNLVFILVDDLGWMDTGHYGSEYYETPNIDRLGTEGMTFTDAHSASPLCSPTRASVLTGKYPARFGLTSPTCHVEEERFEARLQTDAPPNRKVLSVNSATRLERGQYTLAEALSDAGYHTAHVGKWHLGHPPYDAVNHGFDTDVPNTPVSGPVGGYTAPWSFWPDHGEPGQNIEDRMAGEAVEYIHERARGDEPFYLNYWSFIVHAPIDARTDLIEKYVLQWDPENPQYHPVYAAMVETLDRAVGSILDALEKAGVRDETLVIFTADHGGATWEMGGGTIPGTGSPGLIPVTSNAPLRSGKASVYEGGTRVPLIASFPGEIEPNAESDALVSSVDFYPTILEAFGIDVPADLEFDGVSFTPALRGNAHDRGPIFCHFPHDVDVHPEEGPAAFVREEEWKLIRVFHDGPDCEHRHELYDLSTDLSETTDLSNERPDIVGRLGSTLDDHLRETGALLPKPNPAYDPEAV